MGLFSDLPNPNVDFDPEKLTVVYDEAPPYGALSSMPADELVELYNEKAENGSPVAIQKAHLILSELQRREAAERERRMVEANVQVKGLTWAIFVLTLVNVLALVYQVVTPA